MSRRMTVFRPPPRTITREEALERAVRVGMLLGTSFATMADVLDARNDEIIATIARVQARRQWPQLQESRP